MRGGGGGGVGGVGCNKAVWISLLCDSSALMHGSDVRGLSA